MNTVRKSTPSRKLAASKLVLRDLPVGSTGADVNNRLKIILYAAATALSGELSMTAYRIQRKASPSVFRCTPDPSPRGRERDASG
jgi:hypothetical protein